VVRKTRIADIEYVTMRVADGIPEASCTKCTSILVLNGAMDLVSDLGGMV
jgi:hypothetical protein